MINPYFVTISSEKGGVGKTTLATNLAIYLKALHEELPVTIFSFDNHFSVDRMFQIKQTTLHGNVSELFSGCNPDRLLVMGEYGVQFIPSSKDLYALRADVNDPASLAKSFLRSKINGIVIIDTRPDLDIFTQNALYIADRVVVPVKDTPSLENCRHIYDFFDKHQLSRRALRVLPCLIDCRIHFDGPFRDSNQLLKAYAINRGYRCMEGYISKSPKVESLNTNPEGKIYPILTHGRHTDVHIQMIHLARQLYLHYLEEKPKRLEEFKAANELAEQEIQNSFEKRMAALEKSCLVCGSSLIKRDRIDHAGYFALSSDQTVSGYIEEECFTGLVFRYFYGAKKTVEPHLPIWDLFRETAQKSYFLLQRAQNTQNYYQQKLSFYRFDENGHEVSHRTIDLQEYQKRFLSKERSELFSLLERSLFDKQGRLGDEFLLIHKVSSDLPEEILFDQNFSSFVAMIEKIKTQRPT